jgi:hypothetical protein
LKIDDKAYDFARGRYGARLFGGEIDILTHTEGSFWYSTNEGEAIDLKQLFSH